MSYGDAFTAKFDGVCRICTKDIEAGQDSVRKHKIDLFYAHESCSYTDTFNTEDIPVLEERTRVEPSYVQRGKRKNKVCNDCHLEHAGGCW